LGIFVVEGDVLAGGVFLAGWFGTSLAAKTVPEKVHTTSPAINTLSQRYFIQFLPDTWSGYFLPGLIIQKFKKITIQFLIWRKHIQGEG
jgi:hypothetical protein